MRGVAFTLDYIIRCMCVCALRLWCRVSLGWRFITVENKLLTVLTCTMSQKQQGLCETCDVCIL